MHRKQAGALQSGSFFVIQSLLVMNQYSIFISAYEYDVLNKNSIISLTCKRQLRSAIEHNDEVELLMAFREFQELIGYVAAEANHARSKKKEPGLK
jgi:hypothetical protein